MEGDYNGLIQTVRRHGYLTKKERIQGSAGKTANGKVYIELESLVLALQEKLEIRSHVVVARLL